MIKKTQEKQRINLIINETELYYNTIRHGDNYVRRNLKK